MDEKVDEKVDEASQSPAASLRPKTVDAKGAQNKKVLNFAEERTFPKGNFIKRSGGDGVAERYGPHGMRSFHSVRGEGVQD